MAPYPNAGRPVPIPGAPATLADGKTFDSGLFQSQGSGYALWAKASPVLTIHVIRYADEAGAIVVDDSNVVLVANTLASLVKADAKLWGTQRVTIANASGGPSTINNLALVQ